MFQDLPALWDAYFCRLLMFFASFSRHETPIVHATLILGDRKIEAFEGSRIDPSYILCCPRNRFELMGSRDDGMSQMIDDGLNQQFF